MSGYRIDVHQSHDLAIVFPNDPRYSWVIRDEGTGRVVATGWVTYSSAEQAHAEAQRVLDRLPRRLAG
jgi:hypothetical protein